MLKTRKGIHMFIKKENTEIKDFYDCHNGTGLTKARIVLGRDDTASDIRFIHDDILPPGASIGEHPHDDTEELYYIVSGRGTMILDGKEYAAGPGDIAICSPGHSHGIVNSGETDLNLIVLAAGIPA